MAVVERHLVRSATGETIHLVTCFYAKRAGVSPWIWANVATREMILRAVDSMEYRACRVCRPLARL